MYFSRITVSTAQLDNFAKIYQYNYYQIHQLLWTLFREKDEKKVRDFLFYQDTSNRLPIFYIVSPLEPVSLDNILKVETKAFNPQLNKGDKLAFNLRANPVIKMPNNKARHDVVMHLKKSLTEEKKAQYSQARLEQQAGEQWLEKRAERNGFKVHSVVASGYQQHYFKKRKIKLSTLDFEGILEVTNTELFEKALYKGIGSAKAFGCGLILIKRY